MPSVGGSAGAGTGTPSPSPSTGPGFNFGNNRYSVSPNTSVSVAPVSACQPIYDNQATIDALNGLLSAISTNNPQNAQLRQFCNNNFRIQVQRAINEQLAKATIIGNTCTDQEPPPSPINSSGYWKSIDINGKKMWIWISTAGTQNAPIIVQNTGQGFTTPAEVFTGPTRVKCDCPGGVVLGGKCYCQQVTSDNTGGTVANTGTIRTGPLVPKCPEGCTQVPSAGKCYCQELTTNVSLPPIGTPDSCGKGFTREGGGICRPNDIYIGGVRYVASAPNGSNGYTLNQGGPLTSGR